MEGQADPENSALGWLAGASKGERMHFLRMFLNILDTDQLDQVSNLASRAKKRRIRQSRSEAKKAKSAKITAKVESVPVGAQVTESAPTATEVRGWFRGHRPVDLLAFDVEKVDVIIPNAMTRKKYVQKAAKVTVVNKNEKVVYQRTIYQRNGTYRVTPFSMRINGIRPNSLGAGTKPDVVIQELKDLFAGKLIVGLSLASDFESLSCETIDGIRHELPMGDFDVFDLQWWWYKSKENDLGQEVFEELGLRSLCKYFFKIDMQPEHLSHSDYLDAVWTLRLFLDVYVKLRPEPNVKSNPFPSNEIKHFKSLYL